MPAFNNSKSMRYKLVLIIVLSLGGLVSTLALFYQGISNTISEEQIKQTQYIAELGIAQIDHYQEKVKSGDMPLKKAQTIALELLESESYGTHGYFWVQDSKGLILMHPFIKEIVNVNVIENQNYAERETFLAFANKALSGGGIVEYLWPKPNTTQAVSKSSYVQYFEEWDWILGTGVYMDEVQHSADKSANQTIGLIIIFASVFSLSALLVIISLLQQLKSSAVKDPISTLYTRRFLMEVEEELLQRVEKDSTQQLTVIYIDLDQFKAINDQHGLSKGDEIIQYVGQTISKHTQLNDICVRYGSEEFVILTLSNDKETPETLINTLQNDITKKVFKGSHMNFSITLSTGSANHKNGEDLDHTIKQAEHHLTSANKTNENNFITD